MREQGKEWARLSRRMVASERRGEMRGYPDEGHGSWAAAPRVQRSIAAPADADHHTAPPEGAVREIKNLFARHRRRPSSPALLRLDLVLDSSMEPAPGGVRGRGASRQLLLESDEFALDLQLSPGGGGGVVTGLLARRGGEAMSRIAARLVLDDRVTGQAISDENGVFELDADLGEPAELWLQVAKEERIVVPLDPLY